MHHTRHWDEQHSKGIHLYLYSTTTSKNRMENELVVKMLLSIQCQPLSLGQLPMAHFAKPPKRDKPQ